MNLKSLWAVGTIVALASCGGGDPITPVEEIPGGLIIVRVSAGAPLEGVNAVAYAIDPVTGEPLESRPEGAILAQAERSSASGHLELKLPDDATFHGPIQVVVTGTDIHYTDPTDAAAKARVSLPNSFRLTSFVPTYTSGTTVTVPVTLWTTLADSAARAYAAGRTSESASPSPIERAFPIIDNLFSKHLSRPLSWDLRASVPVEVGGNVGSIRDVVFAALADIGLNQLARDISVTAGHQPGAVITAYQLLELLQADISDGVFNGLEGEMPLAARGGVYELTSRTTRFDLARALGAFVDAPANATGLTRQSLESYSVFDNIALDRNFLYPADEDPEAFDAVPPEVSLLEALPEYVAEETLTVRVTANDNAVGVARVRALVQNADSAKLFEAQRVEDHWAFELGLVVGANSIRIWAEDESVPANSGEGWGPPHSIQGTVVVDVTAPTLSPVSRNSHRNEDGAPLVLEGGRPVVPGRLNLAGREWLDIGARTPAIIKKTYVTSSWGARNPQDEKFGLELDLEGENPLNLPFRQFEVPFAGGGAEAPLEPVRWRFEASDDNWATTHVSEGTALEAAEKDDGKLFFNVVFSRETIPLLATTRAREVKLKLFVTVSDAAGNTRPEGEGFENTYVFVDTPLHYVVDSGYPAARSSRSLYGYFANREEYRILFGTTSAVVAAGSARVGRVEVFNPWSVPVAVAQSSTSYFRFAEVWDSHMEEYADATVTMDGFTFNRAERWASAAQGGTGWPGSCLEAYDSPCGVGNWRNTKHLRHDVNSNARLTCGAGAAAPLSAFTVNARLLHSNARYVVTESAGTEVMAQRVGTNGLAVVEAATEFAPGRLVVFPGLSAAPFGDRAWNSTWTPVGNVSLYRELAGIFYADLGAAVGACDDGLGRRETGLVRYEARKWNRDLKSATSEFSGSLEFQAWPVYTDGATRLEVGPAPASVQVPFSVAFVHKAVPGT